MSELTDLAAELVVLRIKAKEYEALLQYVVQTWESEGLDNDDVIEIIRNLVPEIKASIPEEK